MDKSNAYFSLRRVKALCIKETYQIIRDPSSLLIAVILPIILLLIFGFGISLDSTQLRIGVVNEDEGAQGHEFALAIAASPYIVPVWGHSRDEMQQLMDDGAVRGMIVIPPDFSKKVGAAVQGAQGSYSGSAVAQVQVVADGSQPNTANFVISYAQGAWMVWQENSLQNAAMPAKTSVNAMVRYWFNPTAISRNYLIPGGISIVMTIIGALLTSMVIAREWERGTMEALLTTPMTRFEFLLSKVIPYYLCGMLSMSVCVATAVLFMEVPFRGSLFILFIAYSLFMGAALGMGLLISTVSKSQFNAAQIALNTALLPAVLLSGFMFEIGSMPEVIQWVTYIVPARYFVAVNQTLFQAGNIWSVIGVNFFFLLLLAIFWLGLTALKTKKGLRE